MKRFAKANSLPKSPLNAHILGNYFCKFQGWEQSEPAPVGML